MKLIVSSMWKEWKAIIAEMHPGLQTDREKGCGKTWKEVERQLGRKRPEEVYVDGLFYVAISSSGYIASHDRVNNELN
jgi:hypothetical protein